MTIAGFLAMRWSDPGEALIAPPPISPIIADPSFLFPEESPSGDWELFAHSAWGIHRYSSIDGSAWRHRGMVVPNAMRAFIRSFAGPTGPALLSFEAYPALALARTALPVRARWRSSLAQASSMDLAHWTRGPTILSPELDWMRDSRLGASVSNPCLLQAGPGEWRLYFSASLSWIDDCGFTEPRHLGLALGKMPGGPFVPRSLPLLDPAGDQGPGQLGSGSIKVISLEDGYVGLQNRIYRDPSGRSRSAIFVLASEDGIGWRMARTKPLVQPGSGWMASHVYACDCRERDGRWYLYFNARDAWRISEGRERIGRIRAET